MSEELGIGIIGAGGIARSHLEALSGLAEARAAVMMAVDGDRARAVAGEFGGRPCTRLGEVLADPQVQAVHICTPHHLHADQVELSGLEGRGPRPRRPVRR